jgi:hypothetical protein
MALLVLWAGPGPLSVVPDHACAGPNHAGRGSTHLPRTKFSGLVGGSEDDAERVQELERRRLSSDALAGFRGHNEFVEKFKLSLVI